MLRKIVLLSILLSFGLVASMSHAALVAYWSLDEDSGTEIIDQSGNGNTGTINGASWVPGKSGSALEFDGVHNYAEVPDSDSLDITDEISVSAWVKFISLQEGDWKNLLRKEGAYVLEITGANEFQFNIWTGGDWQNAAFTATKLQTDVWYYLTGSYVAGEGLKAYIDGSLDGTSDKTGQIDVTENNVFIGTGNVDWLPANCILDEIKIWDEALTADEIVAEMEAGPTAVESSDKLSLTWGKIKVTD